MRIVLDTRSTSGRLQGKNCLLQSVFPSSPYWPVWESIVAGESMMCVSNEIPFPFVNVVSLKDFLDLISR